MQQQTQVSLNYHDNPLTLVVSLLAQSEIYRNREFYRTQDVRPPFTYASLIRQVRKEQAAFFVSLMQKPPMQCYPLFSNLLYRFIGRD